MALLICAATAKELKAAAPGLLPEEIEEMRPMALRRKWGQAIFLVTGVGPVNAAMALGYCLGLTHENSMRLEGVLNIGLAGAFDLAKTPLRSIWQVRREIWPEYGLNDGVSVTARAFSHPLWTRAGQNIYESLDLAGISTLSDLTGARVVPEWPECSSLTVAGVTASFDRKEFLWNAFHAELENMEGFACVYAASRAEIPCVEIRAVSNKVGPRSREEKDFDGALAAMAKILPSLNLI